jgi:hypothetical protein
VGIPSTVGFGPQLIVVSGLSVGIPSTVRFRLSRSHRLSRSPFTFFPFSYWNCVYHRAFHELFLSYDGILAIREPFTNFFFHTMEFWLSQSLSRTFSFIWWNSGYHGAFHEFFLSYDGILAITEPFTNFSHGWAHETDYLGETLFLYTTKSIYIGSASLKTLPLDLEPPLQGKEYGPPYSKEIAKRVNVFVPETTYRLVAQFFRIFIECKLTKRNVE